MKHKQLQFGAGFRVWGVVERPDGPRLQSATSGFCGGTTLWEPYEAFAASCLALETCGRAPNGISVIFPIPSTTPCGNPPRSLPTSARSESTSRPSARRT